MDNGWIDNYQIGGNKSVVVKKSPAGKTMASIISDRGPLWCLVGTSQSKIDGKSNWHMEIIQILCTAIVNWIFSSHQMSERSQ